LFPSRDDVIRRTRADELYKRILRRTSESHAGGLRRTVWWNSRVRENVGRTINTVQLYNKQKPVIKVNLSARSKRVTTDTLSRGIHLPLISTCSFHFWAIILSWNNYTDKLSLDRNIFRIGLARPDYYLLHCVHHELSDNWFTRNAT